MVHPVLVLQIPVDGQDDFLFKGGLGVPAQVVFDFGGIDAVAAVVAQAVFYVLDKVLGNTLVIESVVELLDDGLDDENIGPLVSSTSRFGIRGSVKVIHPLKYAGIPFLSSI